LVPVKNGCNPDAPVGWHSTHAGAVLEGAAVAGPEEPPVLTWDDDIDRAPDTVVLMAPLDGDPVLEAPDAGPVVAAPVVAVAGVVADVD
jgi:hypothetical protein